MRRIVAAHGGAATAHRTQRRVGDVGHVDHFYPAQLGLFGHVLHEMPFGGHCDFGAASRVHHVVPQEARGAVPVGQRHHLAGALGVRHHLVALALPPGHVLGLKHGVHAAEAAPQNHLRGVDGRLALDVEIVPRGAQLLLRTGPHGQLVHAQRVRGVSAQVLVGHKEDALTLLSSPVHHFGGVAGGAHRAAALAGDRLHAARRVHVGHHHDVVAKARP